jgi:hypothetical protein
MAARKENILEDLKLRDVKIKITNLMLDPNNPRLTISHNKTTSDLDIASNHVQESTFGKMLQKRFDIPNLEGSIKTKGLVLIDNIFVKKVDKENYVVLEGNRRLTAIKELLRKHNLKKKSDVLPPDLLNQLGEISCKELLNPDVSKIAYILGIRHQGGPLIWGALEQANGRFMEYIRIYEKEIGEVIDLNNFNYEPQIARIVANTLNITIPKVKNSLRNYVAYHQMINDDYDLCGEDYSFFEEAFKKTELREQYFELDKNNFNLPEAGREKFWNLSGFKYKPPSENRPIKHSIEFREFGKIVAEKDEKQIIRVEEGENPKKVWDEIESSRAKSSWLDSLNFAFEKLNSGFSFKEFKGSTAEINLIEKIDAILEKLKKMI